MSDENGTAKVVKFESKAQADALRDASLRALIIKGAASPVLDTRGISNPWDTYGGSDEIIEPPLNPDGLIDMVELSTELPTNIAAMEVNIPGFGWRVKRVTGVEDSPEVDAEKNWIDEFLTYVDYDELSFTNLRRRSRKEIETTGSWYWEVLRDGSGKPCSFRLIPSNTMRMTKIELQSVSVDRLRPTGSGNNRKLKSVSVWRRFKRFVQARHQAGSDEPELVYFREYGDPRQLDWRTGEFADEVAAEYRATEILHSRIYSARTPYGVPRWIGAILTASGLRAGEEINFVTFKNNNVPSLALLVSNGQLTQATIDRLKEFMEASIQGDDNWSKIVVIEALGGDDDDPEGATVKLDIKPLTNSQHTDALFQNYDKQGREKIRRMFRLPPIFTGATDEYNRATAITSRKLADEQVFDPERRDEDWMINRVLTDMGMRFHRFETNTPNVTNDQDLIAVMQGAEKAGGMTPAIARIMLEDILGRELGPVAEGVNPDVPFSMSMAEAVKNLAKPNEPGQQVTALKAAARTLGLVDEWGAALDLVELAKGEGVGGPRPDVVLNVGSQAGDLAAGTQPVYLSAVALGLDGRELAISDGATAVAKVRFGARSRLPLDAAAKAAGLDPGDVGQMFPGRFELWALPVEAREKFDEPIAYEHPAGSKFGFLVS